MAKPDFYLEIIDRMIGETPTKRIMQYFCDSVKKGEEPDPRVMKFFLKAFEEIIIELDDIEENDIEGQIDPKRSRKIGAFTMKALNLGGKRGRKNSLASKSRLGYGQIVRAMVHEMDENNLTYLNAKTHVSKKMHISESKVEKAYKEFGGVWRSTLKMCKSADE